MTTLLITDNGLKIKEALEKMVAQIIVFESDLFNEKKGVLYKSVLKAIEKPLIEQTLERTEGNQLKAARLLGLNRNTLRVKIKKLEINVEKWKIT
jgi:DNA-binding protein Fis